MGPIVRTIALLSCLATAASADVGKEELKKLVEAGLSDDLILNYVRYKAPLARISADDLLELKKAGLSDSLLTRLLPFQEPAADAPAGPRPASTAAATAKLLADPDIVYDGHAFYPRSYFSSDHAAYSSAAIGFSTVNPGWYGACAVRTGATRWGYSWGSTCVRPGFGFCSSGGPRYCYR
jgi:hypothetical protein